MNGIEFLQQVTAKHIASNAIGAKGHNGPYNDPETPVRNLGHWIITLANLRKYTGDDKYLQSLEELTEQLLHPDYRPFGTIFHHRSKENKDETNGLIGPAWTIEALTTAAKALDRPDLQQTAADIFHLHPFYARKGLWKRLNLKGEVLGFDSGFNHQLWFAYAGSLISSEYATGIREKVTTFLDKVSENLALYDNGLIFHLVSRNLGLKDALYKSLVLHLPFIPAVLPGNTRQKYRELRYNLRWKAVGYHAFNMYAFAFLKNNLPEHPLWEKQRFKSVLAYLESNEYKQEIREETTYGFPYNPPGFEVPMVLSMLSGLNTTDCLEESNYWLNLQIEKTFDTDTLSFSRNNPDPVTLTARIYEMSQWPEALLNNVTIKLP